MLSITVPRRARGAKSLRCLIPARHLVVLWEQQLTALVAGANPVMGANMKRRTAGSNSSGCRDTTRAGTQTDRDERPRTIHPGLCRGCRIASPDFLYIRRRPDFLLGSRPDRRPPHDLMGQRAAVRSACRQIEEQPLK